MKIIAMAVAMTALTTTSHVMSISAVPESQAAAMVETDAAALATTRSLLERARLLHPEMTGYIAERIKAGDEGLDTDSQRNLAEYDVLRELVVNHRNDLIGADTRELRRLVSTQRTFLIAARNQDEKACDAYVSGQDGATLLPTPAVFDADRTVTMTTVDMMERLALETHADTAYRSDLRAQRLQASHDASTGYNTSQAAKDIDMAIAASAKTPQGLCRSAIAYDDAVMEAPDAEFDRVIGEWFDRT